MTCHMTGATLNSLLTVDSTGKTRGDTNACGHPFWVSQHCGISDQYHAHPFQRERHSWGASLSIMYGSILNAPNKGGQKVMVIDLEPKSDMDSGSTCIAQDRSTNTEMLDRNGSQPIHDILFNHHLSNQEGSTIDHSRPRTKIRCAV